MYISNNHRQMKEIIVYLKSCNAKRKKYRIIIYFYFIIFSEGFRIFMNNFWMNFSGVKKEATLKLQKLSSTLRIWPSD